MFFKKQIQKKGDVCLARAYTHHRKFVFVNSIIADMESMETLYKHGLLNESQNFFFFKRRICYVSQMTVSHAFVAKHKSIKVFCLLRYITFHMTMIPVERIINVTHCPCEKSRLWRVYAPGSLNFTHEIAVSIL